MPSFQTLPGFREFYPDALARRNHLFKIWRGTAVAFGFQEYDAPVLEPLDLYRTKSGTEIEQQLFSFVDKGGREVALRPEMTPTVCRLVGEKAATLRRPIKWFSIAEFYRYERMQKGRGRCFFQFNADVFGEPGLEAETELIALLIQCLAGFGLTHEDFFIRLSDRNLWFYFLEALGFDDAGVRAMLGAIDKYEKLGDKAFADFEEVHGTLQGEVRAKILALLSIRSMNDLEAFVRSVTNERVSQRLQDWRQLIANLDAMGLGSFVSVDLGVVRGLAYYTGFVFEAFDRKGELRALAGGGRYDNLTGKLGYADLPAVGFAIGDMTFALLLEQRGLTPSYVQVPDVFCVIGGDKERMVAFGPIHALRACGVRVDYPLKQVAFGKQFKTAAESGASLALIFGQDEVAAGKVKIRDLRTREEREIALSEVVPHVLADLRGEV